MAFLQAGMRRALMQTSEAFVPCRQLLLHRQPILPAAKLEWRPRCAISTGARAPTWAATARLSATPYKSQSPPSSVGRQLSTVAASAEGSVTAETVSTASRASPSRASSASSFPDTSSKAVAYWLIGSAISVLGIVVWGGLTRLTESGITEWKPITGSIPPRTDEDWEAEFTKYRSSPEYARLNPHMTIDEFKKIYFMEWSHRLWGRFVGVSFILPALYFVVRRRVTKRMAWNFLGISCLIGFQGFIGWWMVRSGLRDELFAPGAEPPRVSQYRLATHLAAAVVCYSWMLLTGLSVLRDLRVRADPAAAARVAADLAQPVLRPFRRSVMALTALVFVTAMSGALVAGLDAGLIYNEFPMMGTGLAPPSAELWNPRYSRKPDHSDLWWRNMMENPSLVQLDHRILAMTTFSSVLALFVYARRGRIAAVLPRNVKRGTTGVVHLVLLQATLGICTLLYMVPTHLAATHQAGSLALLTGVLVLGHRLRMPKSTLRLIQKYASTALQPTLGSRVASRS